MAAHAYEGSATGGAVMVSGGGRDLVVTQCWGDGRRDDSGEHDAAPGERGQPTVPATAGDAIALGQYLSPGVDHHPGGAPESAPPPCGVLRARAMATVKRSSHTER